VQPVSVLLYLAKAKLSIPQEAEARSGCDGAMLVAAVPL
jgi:hypothetical protein